MVCCSAVSRCFDMEHPSFHDSYHGRYNHQSVIRLAWAESLPRSYSAFRAIETGASVVHHCIVGACQSHDRCFAQRCTRKFRYAWCLLFQEPLLQWTTVVLSLHTMITFQWQNNDVHKHHHFWHSTGRWIGVRQEGRWLVFICLRTCPLSASTLYAAVFGDVLPLLVSRLLLFYLWCDRGTVSRGRIGGSVVAD